MGSNYILRLLSGPLAWAIVNSCSLNLESKTQSCLSLLIWIVLWWILEPIPVHITSLLIPVFAVVFGLADIKGAFSPFADPLIFLFMGGYFIAKSMSVHGLDKRVTLKILMSHWVGSNATRSIFGLLFVTAMISMVVSNTATAAMMLPITIGLTHRILKDHSHARALVLSAVAYACSVGGIATPVGSTPNIIGIGMYEKMTGAKFTFFGWTAFGFPTMLLLLSILCLLTWIHLPKKMLSLDRKTLADEMQSLGKFSFGEKISLLSLLVAIFLWLAPGGFALLLGENHDFSVFIKSRLPEALGSLIGAALLFIIPNGKSGPCLSWDDAKTIDWASLLLFGGGLTLGSLMFDTGVAQLLGDTLLSLTSSEQSVWIFVFLSIIITVFLTAITSNTATASMVLPVVISASQKIGLDPMIPTMGVTLAASLDFMLPVGTPPNAIFYGSGLIPMRTMMRQGLKMNILCSIALLLCLMIFSFLRG